MRHPGHSTRIVYPGRTRTTFGPRVTSGRPAVDLTPTAGSGGGFTTAVRILADAFCPSEQCTPGVQGRRGLKWIDVPYDLTG